MLPHVKCYLRAADRFHGLEGLKHMPTAIVPGIYDPNLADETLVETEDAYTMVRRLAREEGCWSGISSGANLLPPHSIAQQLVDAGERGVIVTILCDGADKYLSEHFWDDSGLNRKRGT